jgi:hypothetical protein
MNNTFCILNIIDKKKIKKKRKEFILYYFFIQLFKDLIKLAFFLIFILFIQILFWVTAILIT